MRSPCMRSQSWPLLHSSYVLTVHLPSSNFSISLTATAVARTPSKLRDLLVTSHGIPPSTIDQHLTIFQGDVKDRTAVSQALISPLDPTALVDVILSGVGAYPTFQWSLRRPFPLTDPTITEAAMQTIFAALGYLNPQASKKKPLLVPISTAGCGRRRGIPAPVYLPYHWLLGSPLADKQRMEAVVFADHGVHVRDYVVVRPPFLTEGEARGEGALRVGWEWGDEEKNRTVGREPGPAVGYTCSRKDIGAWIFEKVIVREGWEGKCVYLTY